MYLKDYRMADLRGDNIFPGKHIGLEGPAQRATVELLG